MLVFPIGHIAVGVFLTYKTLADLLNTTTLRVDSSRVSVSHGPIPWRGVSIESTEVRQIFVRQVWQRGKRGSSWSTFGLAVVDTSGAAIDLLSNLGSMEEAKYIEQAIERHLAIEDDPSANVVVGGPT